MNTQLPIMGKTSVVYILFDTESKTQQSLANLYSVEANRRFFRFYATPEPLQWKFNPGKFFPAPPLLFASNEYT